MYTIIRTVLFWFPPETVHYFSMNCLRLVCRFPLLKKILAKGFSVDTSTLRTKMLGLHFRNPVGLAAGFDKNALYLNELEALGFGFVEIGTVTPLAQDGNERPRLFRLPADRALINRMGFNNQGVKAVAERLRQWNHRYSTARRKQSGNTNTPRLIIGGNIGKNKITPNEEAWRDYEICFRELFDCVDYFVVNVSSPNTPGLRALQEKESLRKILSHLQTINRQHAQPKPLLLKIAPDLTREQVDDVIVLAMDIQLDGLVAANTTISREGLQTSQQQLAAIGAGGLSGKPLTKTATELMSYIHQQTGGKIALMASGGIFTGADAAEKLDAGADLVQVWTGFIYEGPAIVKSICAALFQRRTAQKKL
jgi:dihydroorotate dehydrogenase